MGLVRYRSRKINRRAARAVVAPIARAAKNEAKVVTVMPQTTDDPNAGGRDERKGRPIPETVLDPKTNGGVADDDHATERRTAATLIFAGAEQDFVHTRCGREIMVSHRRVRFEKHPADAVVLRIGCRPYDEGEIRISLTSIETRQLAQALLAHAETIDRLDANAPSH